MDLETKGLYERAISLGFYIGILVGAGLTLVVGLWIRG